MPSLNAPDLARSGVTPIDDDPWRSYGSHLKLHWLSPPTSVLVVAKPGPAALPTFRDAAGIVCWCLISNAYLISMILRRSTCQLVLRRAIDRAAWLVRHGVTVYVEPSVLPELQRAVDDISVDGTSKPPAARTLLGRPLPQLKPKGNLATWEPEDGQDDQLPSKVCGV